MDIIYKMQTNKTLNQAVEDLKKSLAEYKFGVLWELNLKDKLNEKGLDFNKNFKVLEVCNPVQAKKVLETQIEVGYFLPCKMVVYEDLDSVFIGMLKPTGLIELLKNDKLTNIALEVEKDMKSAINKAI